MTSPHVVAPFNVEAVTRRPSAPICVTDIAAAVPAVEALLPSHAVLAVPPPNGADQLTNWAIVAGGYVILWPSRDLSVRARQLLSHALKAAGARKVVTLKLDQGTPDDALDALGQGWDETATTAWLQSQGVGEPHCAELPDDPGPQELEVRTGASPVERWLAWGLDLDAKGKPVTNMNNVSLILERDPSLKATIWFDHFHQRIRTGSPPVEWGDSHLMHLQRYIQSELGMPRMSDKSIKNAVIHVSYMYARNEVRDWMEGLEWDGIERISHFFPDYFGTPETAYSTAVSRNFWLSMAARVYKPGCKVDNMVILEGKQGAGKSHALHIIGGNWYAEQNTSVKDPQKFAENIQGKLIMEIGEMDSFHGAEMTRVKQTVTCTSDRYRDSYGHYSRDHPRQGIFAGTTNKDDWNRDETGARRFWPVKCIGAIDLAGIAQHRQQLFAESAAALKAGEKWWIMPEAETEAEQRDRFIEDPWDQRIDELLSLKTAATTSELLSELGIPLERQGRAEQMRIARRLTFLGWTKHNTRIGGRQTKTYKKQGSSL